MEWNSVIYERFQQFIQNIPETLRVIDSRMIKIKAEEIAKKQGVKLVEEEILIDALLSVTPNTYLPLMFQCMKEHGIKLEKDTKIDAINKKGNDIKNYLKYDRKCY